MKALDLLRERYERYVDGFRGPGGELKAMMELKFEHIRRVTEAAETIAGCEGFDAQSKVCAIAAAQLHDTGRYEQLRRFDTFQDSKSVDHAVLSHDIVRDGGWLDEIDLAVGGEDRETVNAAILNAIAYHNRRDLPAGMDALTAAAALTVRDADKLDIFRVLEEQVSNADWHTNTHAFWDLAIKAPPSPAVVEAIAESRPVDYQHIRSLADFVLIQVGWMRSELYYATTRRLARERGHLDFRRDFLHQLTDDESIDRLCDLAGEALA